MRAAAPTASLSPPPTTTAKPLDTRVEPSLIRTFGINSVSPGWKRRWPSRRCRSQACPRTWHTILAGKPPQETTCSVAGPQTPFTENLLSSGKISLRSEAGVGIDRRSPIDEGALPHEKVHGRWRGLPRGRTRLTFGITARRRFENSGRRGSRAASYFLAQKYRV